MMSGGAVQLLSRGRVNPIVPALVVVAGAAIAVSGHHPVGYGLAAGGLLAYLNGLLLSRRVDSAAAVGNVAGALLVMQLGFLVTLTVIGVAEIILVRFSLAAAVASAAGFAVAQLAILAAFYWSHGRAGGPAATEA